MTLHELRELSERFEFRPIGDVRIHFIPEVMEKVEGLSVRLLANVEDRDGAGMIVVTDSKFLDPRYILNDIQFACILRDFVASLYMHEVNEGILVGGRRIFDPHKGDPI